MLERQRQTQVYQLAKVEGGSSGRWVDVLTKAGMMLLEHFGSYQTVSLVLFCCELASSVYSASVVEDVRLKLEGLKDGGGCFAPEKSRG